MDTSILAVSERGQVTIPQKVRAQFKVKFFSCRVEDEKIVLVPLQTRDDFLEELDEAEAHWKKHGGTSLRDIGKKYNL
ncbi:MAG: AbrB/MazE/SpoVT family DNA-binding domain-containing protein [Patescibacteria group bacterium]